MKRVTYGRMDSWNDCTCLDERPGKDTLRQEKQEHVRVLNPAPHPLLRQVLCEVVDPASEAQALQFEGQHAHLIAARGLICKARSG